jgi:hypothetical protein
MMKSLLAAAALLALPAAALAEGQVLYPHAQSLADGIVAKNGGMLDAIMHVSPQPDAKNVVIAAHLTKANGEDSGEDDLGVMKTGAPLVEVQKDGVRLGILVQMRDARHQVIGALGLMYAYKPGDDIEAAVRRSFAIRDALATRIPSRAALVG